MVNYKIWHMQMTTIGFGTIKGKTKNLAQTKDKLYK